MQERNPQDKQNPREIPTQNDPNKTSPEKSTKINPEIEPTETNPRNPKEDF